MLALLSNKYSLSVEHKYFFLIIPYRVKSYNSLYFYYYTILYIYLKTNMICNKRFNDDLK